MIVVTGHKGFIGSHLMKRFPNAMGVEIDTCFDFLKNIDNYNIDCIYHMGAISSTTETDISKLYKYNIEYSIALFEACIRKQIPVKYASSASVYGNKNSINPLNYYALSKATVDYWVEDNAIRFKSVQGYRFYNVYGNGEDHKGDQASPITKFRKQAINTGKIKIFHGSSGFYRDFICVEDVCNVMGIDKPSGRIYDVGAGLPRSFLKVAEIVAKKYDATIEYVKFPEHLIGKYQAYTISGTPWNYSFTSIEEWLEDAD